MLIQSIRERLKPLRFAFGVIIEEGNIIAFCGFHSPIHGDAEPGIIAHLEEGRPGIVLSYPCLGSVIGAVIHKDQLIRGARLPVNRGQAGFEEVLAVSIQDDQGDSGHMMRMASKAM